MKNGNTYALLAAIACMLRLFLPLFCMSLLLVVNHAHGYAAPRYFLDQGTKFSGDTSAFPKWTGMLERYTEHMESTKNQCGETPSYDCDHAALMNLLREQRGKPERQIIEDVNTYMNAHPYIIDQVNWGKDDYWEIPHEFEEVSGDCEDYAISKYMALRLLNVPEEDMRIVILQDLNLGGIIHAILAVKYKGDYLVLDNQIQHAMPAKKIYHYRPIYALNEAGWWQFLP